VALEQDDAVRAVVLTAIGDRKKRKPVFNRS
jgi:hypothetical protein